MKEIYIKNQSELNKKMKIYKKFLYKDAIIKANFDNEEDQAIVQALNIKNRKKRLEFIYDYSCKKIDLFNEGKNICGFSNGKCVMQQGLECKNKNGCCRACTHQSENGCKTSNLSCKLYYCSVVTNNHKVVKYGDLKMLKLLSLRQRIMIRSSFFSTREQILNDLYAGSIVLYAFRIVTREINRSIELARLKKTNAIK